MQKVRFFNNLFVDFYTSEVGRVHITSSSSPRKLNRTPPMGTQMLNSNNSSSHMSQSICSTNAYAMSRDKNSNAPKLSKQHTVHVDDYYGNELAAVAVPPQHSFLKKSMSAHDGIRDPNGSLKGMFYRIFNLININGLLLFLRLMFRPKPRLRLGLRPKLKPRLRLRPRLRLGLRPKL
jgi:hypothetical protein